MPAFLKLPFILLLIALLSGSCELSAQRQKINEKFYIGLQFGGRTIQRDSLKNTGNLDFMNYLYQADNGPDYGYAGINFRFTPVPGWEFSATTILLSDLIPGQLNFDIRHTLDSISPHLEWGLMGSVFASPQYLEEFNQYHLIADTGYTADLNTNFRQITLYDLGLAAGPFIVFQYRGFHGQFSIRGGFSGFAPFKESISQKKTAANLRREIRYETDYSPTIFIYPEAEAGIDLINSGQTHIGVLLRAGGLFSKRSINYTRTTMTWTAENSIIGKILPEKKLYSRMEIEGGLYIRF